MSKRLTCLVCVVALSACAHGPKGKAGDPTKGDAAAVAAAAAAAKAKRPRPETPEFWRADGQAALERLRKATPSGTRAKNLILFIGDGMGVSTVTAARILQGQNLGGDGEENQLAFDDFPVTALVKTYNADLQTPESAGSMTAMLSGVKTLGASVGLDQIPAKGQCQEAFGHETKSLLEQAKDAGLSVGLVATMRVTHAVPAAAYAHVSDRDWEIDEKLSQTARDQGCRDIARQLVEFDHHGGLDLVFGGGRDAFLPRAPTTGALPPSSRADSNRFGARGDGLDLLAQWQGRYANGRYLWTGSQIAALDWSSITGPVLGLFAPDNMAYEADRPQQGRDEPSLTAMTTAAIKGLSRNKHGFVLVVDAGGIDRAHHAGDARRALLDTIELSNAVKAAADLTSPADTLIVVTAGNSHTLTLGGETKRGNPVLGLARNRDGALLKDADGAPYTSLTYANGPGAEGPAPTEDGVAAPSYRIAAAVPLRGETHAGEDTPLYARGPAAQWFHGVMEQHTLYWVMQAALGSFQPPPPPPPPPRPWYKPELPKKL
ncbi:MAG TPA: alkaline phosphatase, partial [Phenylobacterium sp.]